VRLYSLTVVAPKGQVDEDLKTVGFTERDKLLVRVNMDGRKINFLFTTRCNNLQTALPQVKEAFDLIANTLPLTLQ
jgi:hypothetical protein